ncbi:MAG: hypothetical protein V7K21_01220 [Nostoc sp.]|uniref:hypothetical protein n=1 Tax=Nostoc sp. TaxID=1180 RepID=UPI002FF74A89
MLTTDENSLRQRSTVLTLAIAYGLAVANVYYNQPLLADMGRSLNISAQQVGFIPTLTQTGYAVGLLLLVPLGDMMERRWLIVTMLSLLACALVVEATVPNLVWLSVSSFGLVAFVILLIAGGTHLMGLILGMLILDLEMHTGYVSNQICVYNLVLNAESRMNTVYMVTNYTGGALGSFLGTYTWGLWQWNGVCALGFFLLTVAFIAHFSVRNTKSSAV